MVHLVEDLEVDGEDVGEVGAGEMDGGLVGEQGGEGPDGLVADYEGGVEEALVEGLHHGLHGRGGGLDYLEVLGQHFAGGGEDYWDVTLQEGHQVLHHECTERLFKEIVL